MRHYNLLAVHNTACNEIFIKYQDCQYEHPFRKFLGYCNDIEKQMVSCLKEQREINRNKNRQAAKERRSRIHLSREEEETSKRID